MQVLYPLLIALSCLTINNNIAHAAILPIDTASLDQPRPDEGITLYNSTPPNPPDPTISTILTFWFNPAYPYSHWFGGDPAFDAEITTKFLSLVTTARTTTSLDTWTSSPQGSLALIILLDQFPRNIFRTSADAFTSDRKALATATDLVDKGLERELTRLQQVFVYLPYMHIEDLMRQDEAVDLYRELTTRCPPDATEKAWLDSCVDFAVRHQKVIAMFGRFPARNAVLGRKSTEEEIEFLKTHPWGY